MKKGSLIFGALFAAMFAFSVSAAEMVRYEFKYYKDKSNTSEASSDSAKREFRKSPTGNYNAVKVSKEDHPAYSHKGFMRDR